MAIVGRELRAYFVSPVAYVVLTIFVFLSGVFFQTILAQVVFTAAAYPIAESKLRRRAATHRYAR